MSNGTFLTINQDAAIAEAEKGKYQRGEKSDKVVEEDAKKLKMGKGKIPENKEDDENVKLKPIPEKQVIKINCR